MSRIATRVGASAHRGDSSRFRENTLPAIRSAISAGAAFVEIDVRVTSDGAVIVLHDPTLERLWGIADAVSEVALERVQALGEPDARPPLLSDVLQLFHDTASTLLVDMDSPELARPAFEVVSASGISVAWCGDLDGMRIIRSLDPAARIWMPWDEPRAPRIDEIADLAPECINSEAVAMTPKMVEEIHALGCTVTVWTVDDEWTMRWAVRMGVDTVTTNRLGLLQHIISEEEAGGGSEAVLGGDLAGLDVDRAIMVARELGKWAIDYTASTDPGAISVKKDAADLVTDVDIAVERHVREIIGLHFPDHDFVGEEFGGKARPGVPCWYLDPVDGTANFANRVPWTAFSLALVVGREPIVGVVGDPWRMQLFEAAKGRGAFRNGERLELAQSPADPDALSGRVVSTELANHRPWPGMLELLAGLGDAYCTMRIMGSGTMTLLGVAAGRGVGAVIGRFGAVDHVAAALIVSEAGGVVLDETGEANLFPQSGGILSATPAAADVLYGLWREARKSHERT